jgi:hypothetical protein
MTDLISPEMQEGFDFLKDRHLAQSPVTYESLRSADWPDWCQIESIEINVANGIMRWIAQHPDSVRRAVVADLFASLQSISAWADFKSKLWDAMDAAAWLRRWDCWTPQSDLWQAALLHVYHTFNLYFYPSEYERQG